MPEKVRCLRRRTGRRQKLGGAVQGKAAGTAVSRHSAAAGAAEPAGAGGQPSDLPAAGAGGGGGVPGGRQAVRVRQRQHSAIRVLRERPGLGSVSGSGVRRDLSGRGHPAEGAVDGASTIFPSGSTTPAIRAGRGMGTSSGCLSTGGTSRGRTRRTTPLSRRGSRTTRRCWPGSRTISRRWRRCRPSCGGRGWRGAGTSWRDRCFRSLRTTRRTTRIASGPM